MAYLSTLSTAPVRRGIWQSDSKHSIARCRRAYLARSLAERRRVQENAADSTVCAESGRVTPIIAEHDADCSKAVCCLAERC